MRDEHALPGFPENERYGVEELSGAVPRKLVSSRLERGAKVLRELLAHRAVAAVAGHDHIRVGQGQHVFDPLAEFDLHTDTLARTLEYVQHVDPRGAGEVVVVNLHARALVDDFQVVAPLVAGGELGMELRVRLAEEIESDVREDHAPSVGRIRRILFVDLDVETRVVLLREQREIQPGRASADNRDLHCRRIRGGTMGQSSEILAFLTTSA